MTRERLGRLVYERRRALGLSIARAARDAGINRATWTAIEDASRDTETYNYGPVERVLGWASGSIDDILAGSEPTLQATTVAPVAESEPTQAGAPPSPQIEDEAIIRVMRSPKIPEGEKARIVQILIADREREQQRRLALAEDLMRDYNDEAS